jgi:hypothetical protein
VVSPPVELTFRTVRPAPAYTEPAADVRLHGDRATAVAFAGPPTPPATVDTVPAAGPPTLPAAAAGITATPATAAATMTIQPLLARDKGLGPLGFLATPLTSENKAMHGLILISLERDGQVAPLTIQSP